MRTAILVFGALMIASAASADGWNTYANPRFGVAADYPAIFSMRDPEPDNGDGQTFHTPGGDATLTIFGSYNANNQSVSGLIQSYKTAGVNYTYSTAGRNWFVLSGKKDRRIGYLRCNFGPSDVVGCFKLEYLAEDAAEWAPVVERLGRSLRILTVRQ